MMGTENIANAVLIIGTLYLYLAFGLDNRITLILCLFGLGMWQYNSMRRQREQLLKAQVDVTEWKAHYLRAKVDEINRRKKK